MGFGDFAGFLVAWGYWISIWASLPAIAVAFTGSLFKIVPAFQGNRPMAVVITIGVMWLIVFTNLRGVKEAGLVAEVTTYSKLVPFAAISIIGLFFIRSGESVRVQPERSVAAHVRRHARAAHDVRLSRSRVGDSAGRRREGSRLARSLFQRLSACRSPRSSTSWARPSSLASCRVRNW